MLILKTHKKFEKDLIKMIKRGKDKRKIMLIIENLLKQESLPSRCKPHKLIGDWAPAWECHIEPDWLLIYEYRGNNLELLSTGTHSDLF